MLLKKKGGVSDLKHQNRTISVFIVETERKSLGFFGQLVEKVLKEQQRSDLTFEVLDNRNLSSILWQQENENRPLPEEFRKAMSGIDKCDEGYQYVVNTIGELVAEILDDDDKDSSFVLFPDTEYGTALDWHTDAFDARLLPMGEILDKYFQNRATDLNWSLQRFGLIGDYSISATLATLEHSWNDENSKKRGVCLPYDRFDEIAELLRSELPDQEEIEELLIDQVRQLSRAYSFPGDKVILLGNLQLEMLLLGVKTADDCQEFFNIPKKPHQPFLDAYRSAWQERMLHLYNHKKWSKDVKLESALTYYAYVACEIINRPAESYAANVTRE